MAIVKVKDTGDIFKCAACCLNPGKKTCEELEKEHGLDDCKLGHHYEVKK